MRLILQADQRPKQNHKDEILPAHPQELYLFGERTLTDVVPEEYSISDYEVSKKLIHLLRHGSLPRENDGAIEFWRIKDNLQKHFLYCHHWSDEKWKKSRRKAWQEEEETRKDTSIVLIHQEQSCTSKLFKVIQDAVSLIITLTFMAQEWVLHFSPHLHAIHVSGCLSLTRPTPLSTSQPSSCLSSSSPSSTSATSSSWGSTRRSWKTCATPLTTGVRAPTTSSTCLQHVQYDDKESDSGRGQRRAVWIVRDRP